MTFTVAARGDAQAAIDSRVPELVEQLVASRITAGDATLWGPAAEPEASIRLGWTQAVAVSRPLVAEIAALRSQLAERGVTRIVLCGMGGSSLAPEVITRTAGVPLTVLDSTDPGQVASAIDEHLGHTAVVVSSKSGSTVETDSQKRSFEAAFRAIGIDPVERIIIVTDRVVRDQQLQNTVYQFEHKQGVVQKIDVDAAQLAEALDAGVPIVITTLQKFPFVTEKIGDLPKRRYAVIIDEAHSSQGGETATELKGVLGGAAPT